MFNKIIQDNFLRHNLVFFVGAMVVGFFNYLYYPVLGRLMDVESFGEVQAIISLFLLLSMAVGVFRTIVINIVANVQDIKEKEAAILMLQKLGLYIVIAVAALIMIFSRQLESFLNFSSFYPFISLSALLVLSLFFTFRSAILQALHYFIEVSIAGIFLSAGRLIFAVALVYFGWSAFGAITAIVLAQLIALIYVFSKTAHHLPLLIGAKVKITNQIKKEVPYALLALVATLGVTFLYSADILIVKHYFSAVGAGFYSGIATIARIIFFLTGSVAGVLVVHVKTGNSSQENKRTLIKGLFLVGGLGGVVLLTFLAIPDIIIKVLMGQRYLDYAYLLPRLGLVSFAVSLINLLFFYYLALRRYFLAIVAVLSPVFVLVLSFYRHDSLVQIINNFIWVSLLALLILLIRLFYWPSVYGKDNFYYHSGL